jgi:hypothetical protein
MDAMGQKLADDPVTQVLNEFEQRLRTLREEQRLVESAQETFGSFAREVERRTGTERRALPRQGRDRRIAGG